MTKKKEITQFDVFNAMPEGTIDIFVYQAGGKQIGKAKENKAIIEVLVDNETFQDFSFQKMYGEPKSGKKKKFFIMYAIDMDEYNKQMKILESNN